MIVVLMLLFIRPDLHHLLFFFVLLLIRVMTIVLVAAYKVSGMLLFSSRATFCIFEVASRDVAAHLVLE